MKRISLLITTTILLVMHTLVMSQPYLEKQTRHRFAQMNLGFDYQWSQGGTTAFLDQHSTVSTIDLPNFAGFRLLIGGTHFWGHADFNIAIPLGSRAKVTNRQSLTYNVGVETVAKVYPWRMRHGAIRPYIGVSMSSYYFEQDNLITLEDGPEHTIDTWPVLAGFNYMYRNHILEIGTSLNLSNQLDLYLDRQTIKKIELPRLHFSIAYKYQFDTTISAEKDWESGRSHEVTRVLAAKGALDGIFIGAGMSSASWLGRSAYNTEIRPFMDNPGWSLMPDVCFGYYFHNWDFNIATNYRSYAIGALTYGVRQRQSRSSFALEATKYIGDYHGFAPFIGPAVSYDRLGAREIDNGQIVFDESQRKTHLGITFGWDIRPNDYQTFLLRTNLRYFPSMSLEIENSSLNFNALEFNFIQLIIFPSRLF